MKQMLIYEFDTEAEEFMISADTEIWMMSSR